jgi:hypothetical protein
MSNPGGVNLNIGPYFDDYDEDKKFVRVLYRPGRAAQARELTQMQTIQQKQVQRFAEYFFNQGSIVSGCEQTLDVRMDFLKLQPTYFGSDVDVNNFVEAEIVGANTGIRAYVGLASDIEGNDPKTLFINYMETGSIVLNVTPVFAIDYITLGNTINFSVNSWSGYIQSFYQDPISNTYNVYVNGIDADNIVGLEGAFANTIGFDGSSISMLITSFSDKRDTKRFENSEKIFKSIEFINDSSNTSYANTAIVRATSHIENEGTANQKIYQYGSKFQLNEGTVYIADHFVEHDNQVIILDKYKNDPSYKIGLTPNKLFVDTVTDQTLLDNAQGTPNFQALGADRFAIQTIVTKLPLSANTDENEFITVAQVENGKLIQKNTSGDPVSTMEDALARRTFDESGNYTVTDPRFGVREHLLVGSNKGKFTVANGGNTELLIVELDPFTAYVKGFKNETITKTPVTLRKGTDIEEVEQVLTAIAVGSYIEVEEFVGTWNFQESGVVDLYDEPQKAISNNSFSTTTLQGSKIGQARIRSIEYISGEVGNANARYYFYLYDVKMSTGKLFQNSRSFFFDAGGSGARCFADIIRDDFGRAVLKDSSFETAIFDMPFQGIKTVRDINNNVESGFEFRKEFSANFNALGEVTIATTDASETFSSGVTDILSNRNYLVVPTSTANTSALSGTVSVSSSGVNVVGVSTSFLNEVESGDVIRISGVQRVIESVTNNTFLTLSSAHPTGASSVNYFKVFPAGLPIRLSNKGSTGLDRSVTLGDPPSAVSINLQESGIESAFGSGFPARVYVVMNRSNAREKRKILNTSATVIINPSTHPNGLIGPYTLGRADVFRIRSIHQSSSFGVTPTTSNTLVTSSFTFNNGQTDNSYNHGFIRPASGIVPTGRLLVTFDFFTHDTSQGVGYLSVDSYPIDDTGLTAGTITTAQIPKYKSTKSGFTYDLRDSIDLRPLKAANTSAINPIEGDNYLIPPGGLHFLNPGSNFNCDLVFYKGRKANLYISQSGEFLISDGAPGYPIAREAPQIPDTLELAELTIPPYPTLPNTVTIQPRKNIRYTMKDIGRLENRVEKLEYYATLSELERLTKDSQEIDSTGIDRFKNGILVDSFSGHNIGNVINPDYKTAIDYSQRYATCSSNNEIGLSLRYASGSNVRSINQLLMLNYTTEIFENQPYASSFINLAPELVFNWVGDMECYPATDNWLDTTFPPEANTVINLTGIYDNFLAIANSFNTVVGPLLQNWVGTGKTTTGTFKNTGEQVIKGNAVYNVQEAIIFENEQLFQPTANFSTGSTVNKVTERISNVDLKFYIRPRDFLFVANGMKDGARLFAFFDGEDVTANCTQLNITYENNEELEEKLDRIADSFNSSGRLPTSISGVFTRKTRGRLQAENNLIVGIFRVPANRFFVGQREFRLIDDVRNDEVQATTIAEDSIFAQGLSIQKGFDVVTTRPFKFKGFVNNKQTGKTSVRQVEVGRTQQTVFSHRIDPVAQSFFVDETSYPNGVFVTNLVLFFKKKSPNKNLGVTVELREMENGYPSRKVIGGTTARRLSGSNNTSTSNIRTSANGTVPTSFTFRNPVYLAPGAQYAFCVKPDNNSTDFEIWTATLGQLDITNPDLNVRIDKQPASGTVFTSSNDFTWSVRQTQDLKYTIRVAKFNSSGSAVIRNVPYDDTDNFVYNAHTPNIEDLVLPGTSIEYRSRELNTNYAFVSYRPVNNLERIEETSVRLLANTTNETLFSPTNGSYNINAILRTSDPYVSPYIDLQRMLIGFERNIINNSITTNLTGRVQINDANNIVVGTGTQFDTELNFGEYIFVGGQYREVANIANATYLEVINNFSSSGSNLVASRRREENPSGPYTSEARYITRKVQLADGFEASDLVVYLDVNRPSGSNIRVFYKALNESDPDPFDDKFYRPMSLIGAARTTSDSQLYFEEKYVVPTNQKTGGAVLINGTSSVTSGSKNVIGTSTRFFEDLRVSDTIQVGVDRITRVVDSIVNNTFLTVTSNFSTTSSNQEIYRVVDDVIGYTTPDGRTYSGYKYFAIKVVFLTNNIARPPKIKNFRSIALS